jgi:hypothetical protein
MRTYSILSLMGLVLALAVSIAALRNADDHWAGGLLLATLTLLCVALIGGLCGAERSRAGRLGFAIFGGGYFALAFLGLSEGNLARLPTSKLLRYVHERVAPTTVTFTLTGTALRGAGSGTIILDSSMSGIPSSSAVTTFTATNLAAAGPADPATVNVWKQLLPGAAGYEPFSAVGHCLFALLAGLVGALLARRFEKGRERAASASETAL